jgi:hypothetical protein
MASIHGVEGSRIYVRTQYGEPAVAAIKALGAHWDRDRKMWWVGVAKRKALEEALVGSDRAQDEAQAKGEPPARKESPDDIRLTGKGEYKGRTYYLGARTKDGSRVRLLTLPDARGEYLDFWADAALVKVVKTYEPRQVWDGRRYSGRTVTRYTTLGGIARFVADQRDPATRRGECSECGHFGPFGQPCSECSGEGSYC